MSCPECDHNSIVVFLLKSWIYSVNQLVTLNTDRIQTLSIQNKIKTEKWKNEFIDICNTYMYAMFSACQRQYRNLIRILQRKQNICSA